jgi:mandelate racemase
MTVPLLTFRAIRSTTVEVPMTYALGTSRGVITQAPLLLIDLETEEGITGRSYVWSYFPAAAHAIAKMLEEVARVVNGERLAPAELWRKLSERFALIGVQGIVRMAMAGFDVAAWDALAIAAGWPLATLLGSTPKRILAYNSCGLGLMASARLSHAQRGSRRAACGEEAPRRGDRGHGRLQPGAQRRPCARTRPRPRSGKHLLAGRADSP